MSLVNDALKRAQRAQSRESSAPGPAFQTAHSGRASRGLGGLWLALLFVVVLSMAGLLFWQWLRANKERGDAAKFANVATTLPTAAPVTAESVAPAGAPAAIASDVVAPVAAPTQAPARTSADVSAKPVPVVPPEVQAQAIMAPSAAAPVVTNTPRPEPSVLTDKVYKLQSVFFMPRDSSAMVNGKLLHVGSRLDSLKVAAIGRDSVTLVNTAGQTNLLLLP